MRDKENARKAVRDTLAYYDKRTGADNIKSLDSRIAKVRKDIEEMTTAFIEAKSALLRESIERRMTDYEQLIKNLESQKTQLEYERGLQVSENDLLDYIADLLKGNPADKEHQKRIIDNLVYKVFVADDYQPVFSINERQGNGGRAAIGNKRSFRQDFRRRRCSNAITTCPPPESRASALLFCVRSKRIQFNCVRSKRCRSNHVLLILHKSRWVQRT